jgi:hypothetical protein
MAKQLSMKVIADDNKKYKEQIEFPVTAQGEEFIVKFHPYFSPTKISSLVEKMILFFQSASKEKLNIPNEEFDDLVGYFIIKTFSNIKMTTSKKAQTIYDEYKMSIDSPLFELILSSIPEESILDVHKRIFDTIELSAKLENKMKMVQEQIQSLDLENKELLLGEKKKQIPEV